MSSNRHHASDRKFVMVVPEQFIDSKNDATQQQQQQQQHQYMQHHQHHHNPHQQQQLKIHQEMVHLQQQQQQQQQQQHHHHHHQQQQLDADNVYLQRYNQPDPADHPASTPHIGSISTSPSLTTSTTTSATAAATTYDNTGLTQFDLKSKDSKYKRWTPRMDQYLIKLLSDVVHSYPRGAEAEMTKKAWLYVCKQLRRANPETVYLTYSKYLILQHLMNVIHHRYRIWHRLMVHSKGITSGYSYKWNPELGKFQILDLEHKKYVLDVRQVKLILYSDSLNLPNLASLNKSNLISNDFFLSDNLRYISVYHNEILPLVAKLDEKFLEGFEDGDIYRDIPKFGNYPEANNEFFKPLVPVKKSTSTKKRRKEVTQKQQQEQQFDAGDDHNQQDEDVQDHSQGLQHHSHVVFNQDVLPLEEAVDPDLKRARLDYQTQSTARRQVPVQQQQPPPPQQQRPTMQMNIDIENALTSATIAAMNAPPIKASKTDSPYYIKDAKWFNKLIELYDTGHIRADEVLCVCEGVRDNKIPLFMLNVLDHAYYPTRTNDGSTTTAHHRDIPDDETTKRIREFMLPMVYNS
ncbi:hypothetical protein Cantr_02013 [Candida viswanathii]|uniref:Polyadenylation factor subunit 2 n=1 Tax=Candida viswanathii TaxID=5486 RepID=A0A367YMS3_9ASCO|nr:hypothetical protein Cantr_02013 [Candida viswanathii]